MGTGEEVPRNAHKPPLPPIAVDPRFPQILFRKCPVSGFVPTGFFLSEKYGKNHSIGFESHEWEQEPTPGGKCSDLYCTQITENNNK